MIRGPWDSVSESNWEEKGEHLSATGRKSIDDGDRDRDVDAQIGLHKQTLYLAPNSNKPKAELTSELVN